MPPLTCPHHLPPLYASAIALCWETLLFFTHFGLDRKHSFPAWHEEAHKQCYALNAPSSPRIPWERNASGHGGWLSQSSFSKKAERRGLTCAVAVLCYHNTYDILACPHTLECASAVQAFRQNNGASVPSKWSKLQPVSVFWPFLFLYHLTSLLADGFIPTLFVRVSSKNVGRRWKQLVQGVLGLRSGPCFTLFCLAEQTAPGRERKWGEVKDWGVRSGDWCTAAGWVAQTPEVQREPFLFCAVRMGTAVVVWGPLSGETVQTCPISQQPPSLLLSRETSLTYNTQTYPSIHLQYQISWGCEVFCRCPGERARHLTRGREDFYCVSCQAKALFIATKEIPISECVGARVCVCARVFVHNCLKRDGDRPQLNLFYASAINANR